MNPSDRPLACAGPLALGLAILLAMTLAAPTASRAESAPPPDAAAAPKETPAAPAPTESPAATAPAAALPSAAPAEWRPATKADVEPGKTPDKAAPPRKALTPEEVMELPVLRRLDVLSIEKGKEMLADVKDETFGYDESAFYWLVDFVRKLPVESFTPKPDEPPAAYKTLLAMPSSYRGAPVVLRGVYMTVTPFSPPPLALWKDVPSLYECTLREHPIDEARPVATVVVIDDPMAYLRAGDDVVVKGYFYKVRKYEGTKGEGVAPMLVARRLEPEAYEGPLGSGSGAGGNQLMLGLMIGLVLLMMGAFFWVRSRTRSKGPKVHGDSQRPVFEFRLRRPGGTPSAGDVGPGGAGGLPKP